MSPGHWSGFLFEGSHVTDLAERMLFAATEAYAERPTFNPIIAAAQGVLESGDPPSKLAMTYGNALGIKAGTSWSGPTVNLDTGEETPGGLPYNVNVAFRLYGSWRECFLDYARIIRDLPWYQDATEAKADPIAYLLGLVTPGEPSYATDTRYVEKVLRVAYKTGLLPISGPERLGSFDVLVDNSPSVGKAWEHLHATLQSRPARFGRHVASVTPRGEGFKLDVRAA